MVLALFSFAAPLFFWSDAGDLIHRSDSFALLEAHIYACVYFIPSSVKFSSYCSIG
jgi:hypothetical protein